MTDPKVFVRLPKPETLVLGDLHVGQWFQPQKNAQAGGWHQPHMLTDQVTKVPDKRVAVTRSGQMQHLSVALIVRLVDIDGTPNIADGHGEWTTWENLPFGVLAEREPDAESSNATVWAIRRTHDAPLSFIDRGVERTSTVANWPFGVRWRTLPEGTELWMGEGDSHIIISTGQDPQ